MEMDFAYVIAEDYVITVDHATSFLIDVIWSVLRSTL